MLDETTDCTVTEQLVVHARYIDTAGELKSHFLKVIDTLQPEIEALCRSASGNDSPCISVCAETITTRVHEYVDSAQLEMAKMRGIGTDGASTMMGRHSGIVACLKAITPSAIGVHCAAHRLKLGTMLHMSENSVTSFVSSMTSLTIVQFEQWDWRQFKL